jgi:large subunit ribosomal protein L33
MKKTKSPRINITLECIECRQNTKQLGISRYLTSKNKRNLTEKLLLLKYCRYCNKHTSHKEIK